MNGRINLTQKDTKENVFQRSKAGSSFDDWRKKINFLYCHKKADYRKGKGELRKDKDEEKKEKECYIF